MRPPLPRRPRAADLGRPDDRVRRRRPRRPDRGASTRSPDPSTTSRPRPTTSPCWPSPPAPPAAPRRRCTSTATCSRSPTPSPPTCSQPTPDDVFTGTPPLAFTFGLGGLVRLPAAGRRLDAAGREGDAGRARRPRSPTHGVTVCFTAPTAYRAMLAAGKADAGHAARGGVRRRAPADGDLAGVPRGDRGRDLIDGIGSTEMLHIFISAADDDIRPGVDRPRGAGLRRARSLDAEGSRLPPTAHPGRLAVKGPTGCRYLADAAADGLRRRTAGTSPATPSSGTPTATSGTRRAATT